MKSSPAKIEGKSGKSINCKITAIPPLPRERKIKMAAFRATDSLVQMRKDSGRSWSAWIEFLAANYQRSHRGSPVLDPAARRTLVWSARSLDAIASSLTAHACDAAPTTPESFQRAADFLSVLDELERVREALEKWVTSPVIPNEQKKTDAP